MKLLIIIDDLFRGGTEHTLKARLRHIPHLWKVDVVVLYAKGDVANEIEQMGIIVHLLNMSLAGYFKSILKLREIIHKTNPNAILFSRDVARGLMPLFTPNKVKKILFWDNPILYKSFRQFFAEFLQVKLCEHYKLCSSEMIAGNLKNYYGTRQVKVIPNCYDEYLFYYKDIVKLERENKTSIKILTVGNMKFEKNHIEKIEIAALLKKNGVNFSLDIIGRGNFSKLMDILDEYQLDNEINFLGEVSDLYKRIHNYDLFLLTSSSEGCPVALLEAMASGIPCVAYPFDGLSLIDGIEKFIFIPNSKTAMEASSIIMDLIQKNPDELRKHLKATAEFVYKNFSSQKNSLKWFDFCASIDIK